MSLIALNPTILVAIDFGTYGFFTSYCQVGGAQDAVQVRNWPKMQGAYRKNLSAILLHGKNLNRVEAIGFEAYDRYQTAQEEKTAGDLLYFRNFKLQLLKTGGGSFDVNKPISSEDGTTTRGLCPLLSQLLSEIAKHTLNEYQKALHETCEMSDILWILSVPAIWPDESREAMRQCCYDPTVGIPRGNVQILSEPEAAGTYVLWETVEGKNMQPGDRYLCVDIGAGTFDVVCYEVGYDKTLLELRHADGGLCGSNNFDDAFESLLSDLLGRGFVEAYHQAFPADFLETLRNFQTTREQLRLDHYESANVRFGRELVDMIDEHDIDLISRCESFRIPNCPTKVIEYNSRRNHLIVERALWNHFQDPVLKKIVDFICEILKEECVGHISTMFLVGGVSKSMYVRDTIEQMLRQQEVDMNIISPLNPELAVCSGALWAVSKQSVQRRFLPFTYGVAVTKPWIRGDPREKRIKMLGKWVIPQWFHTLFWKGDPFRIGQRAEFEYKVAPGATKLRVEIFRSSEKYPLYVTDNGCEVAMRFDFDLPGHLRKSEVLMGLEFSNDGMNLEVRVDGRVDVGVMVL